ncbi:TPA: hypothetical protein DDW35_03325 [Candidatus Sumerlaeota bacterium]|nr:hypothetical protein [Candidatus Sumerlaeota bacterium]
MHSLSSRSRSFSATLFAFLFCILPCFSHAQTSPSSTLGGYLYLADPSALDTRLPAFLCPSGAKPPRLFSEALASGLGDTLQRVIQPSTPIVCLLFKSPPASDLTVVFAFPENSSPERVAQMAQSVGMTGGMSDGISLLASNKETLALATKELLTIKSLLNTNGNAPITTVFYAPLLENMGNALLKQPTTAQSIAALLSAEILKEISSVQLTINPDLKPRRLDFVVQAKPNTALERFFNQPLPATNALIRNVPVDGPLRASFSFDATLLAAVLQSGLAAVDPTQAAPLKERINTLFFTKGAAAFVLRDNSCTLLSVPESKIVGEQLIKQLSYNGLLSTTTQLSSTSLPVITPSFVAVVGKQDALDLMPRAQAILAQDKQSLLLLPANATVEKFPIQQLFRTDQKPTSLPAEQAVMSVCLAGDQAVVASRYEDAATFVRRVVLLDAAAPPLEAQKVFVDGAHLYLDYALFPNQPCYLTMRLGEGRARCAVVLP